MLLAELPGDELHELFIAHLVGGAFLGGRVLELRGFGEVMDELLLNGGQLDSKPDRQTKHHATVFDLQPAPASW